MCFSAEASLSSAVLLSIIGVATLREVKNEKWQLFALLPFIFAFQQLFEGISWLTFTEVLSARWLPLGKWGFVFFAFLFWPIWMPIALLRAEKEPMRRKLMATSLMGGLIFTIGMLMHFMKPGTDLIATVQGASIQYKAIPSLSVGWYYFLQFLYLYAAILPCFFSSRRGVVLFGALLLSAWLFTQYAYYETSTSVWCFFSAILSGTLYFILREKENV